MFCFGQGNIARRLIVLIKLLFAALIVVLLSNPAVAQLDGRAKGNNDEGIDQLIRALDSEQLEERNRAVNKLIAQGEASIERLRMAAQRIPPPRGQRLLRLADRIAWLRDTRPLREIAVAIFNYADTYRALPAAYTTSTDGKPLLSWRVSILPFMDEFELYQAFHLQEPWDSEHNKPLISRMPKAFQARAGKTGDGMTPYLGVGGKHGVLCAPRPDAPRASLKNGILFSDISDGMEKTAMFVEASNTVAVVWTKPEEWIPNDKNPIEGLIDPELNGFLIVFADAFIQQMPKETSAEKLRSIFSRNDGMPVELRREDWTFDGADNR